MRKLFVFALLTLSVTSVSHGANDSPVGGGNNNAPGDYHVLQVFDSRGRSVGPVFSTSLATGVILNVSGANILVPIQRVSNSVGHYSASQYQWSGASPSFPTTNCSGPPVISDISAALRPVLVVRNGADATAYIAPDGYTSLITLLSYAPSEGQCVAFGSSPTSPPVFSVYGWNPGGTYPLTQNYPEPLTIHY
jgi:hypothetical protein